jgi:integrase
VIEKLRYVEARKNRRDGTVRYYWIRKGFPVMRLPDDLAKRIQITQHLNTHADRGTATDIVLEGSVSWVIVKYRSSERYAQLAVGTKKYYNKIIEDIRECSGDLPWTSWDRRCVVDYIDEVENAGDKRKVAAVLRNLFNLAMYHGLCTENYANNLRLPTGPRRDRWLTVDEVRAWLAAASQHTKGDWAARAFHLLLYTAQRPMDVLRMTRAQFNSVRNTITVRQQKTGKLLEVAIHRSLRRVLDSAPQGDMLLVSTNGKPVSYSQFLNTFQQIAALAGLEEIQPRDLRRTACVMLAEAGATEAQIASVTGHTIENTRQILEHYLPRTMGLSAVAMGLWESTNSNALGHSDG